MPFRFAILVLAIASSFFAGATHLLHAQEKSSSDPAKSIGTLRRESPPFRGLDGTLFMQQSAEYRACCIQAFRLATHLAMAKNSERKQPSLPAAVVLDLDETVLDNGWFQSQQIREQLAFDANRWSQWEQEGADQVRLIPGAKKFIEALRAANIQPVYITNRNNDARQQTMKVLDRLGVAVPDEQLLCADMSTGSNKTSRRHSIEAKFDILLYVGDNLRDFDERFRFGEAGTLGRFSTLDELEGKFGVEWVILPNPAYGEWTKAFSNSPADADLLYK
jgi:5'-nucleotidase (lipoprotein e(P4) family)